MFNRETKIKLSDFILIRRIINNITDITGFQQKIPKKQAINFCDTK